MCTDVDSKDPNFPEQEEIWEEEFRDSCPHPGREMLMEDVDKEKSTGLWSFRKSNSSCSHRGLRKRSSPEGSRILAGRGRGRGGTEMGRMHTLLQADGRRNSPESKQSRERETEDCEFPDVVNAQEESF